jgi:hypothetical protein
VKLGLQPFRGRTRSAKTLAPEGPTTPEEPTSPRTSTPAAACAPSSARSTRCSRLGVRRLHDSIESHKQTAACPENQRT